jgi:hypothetical protein
MFAASRQRRPPSLTDFGAQRLFKAPNVPARTDSCRTDGAKCFASSCADPVTGNFQSIRSLSSRRRQPATQWTRCGESKACYNLPWARGQHCITPAQSFDEPNWETGKNVYAMTLQQN